MKTYQIINYLANHKDCNELWNPYRRYFIILNNYLQGNTLSMVEPKNHKHNPPRLYYLKKITDGFNLSIDPNSVLFENRLNLNYGQMLYNDTPFALPRFFRRLEEAQRANLTITEKQIYDFFKMGEAIFKIYYPSLIPLDP